MTHEEWDVRLEACELAWRALRVGFRMQLYGVRADGGGLDGKAGVGAGA